MKKLQRSIILVTVIGFILGFSGSVLAADGEAVSKGKISINTASVEELTQLKGVGEKIAESIIQFRKENGPFKTVADLEMVKGIGPKILTENADKLTI
jgi:competence ComEA-like helix-hairpin-helix protein